MMMINRNYDIQHLYDQQITDGITEKLLLQLVEGFLKFLSDFPGQSCQRRVIYP